MGGENIVQPLKPLYAYKVAGTAADGSEIRKFGDDNIAGAIDRAIATADLKPDQTVAIVVTYEDNSGESKVVRGAVMVGKETNVFGKKVDFSLVGVLSHDFSTGSTKKEAGLVIKL